MEEAFLKIEKGDLQLNIGGKHLFAPNRYENKLFGMTMILLKQ